VQPLEECYNFGEFASPILKPSDFDAKPMVLLLGQYSVGKTSFIRFIIGRDFPGARIGPEPTTDRFNAVMYGPEDRIIPGNALAVDPSLPFTSLTRFGTEFLNKFQASVCKSPTLEKMYFIDTPGVLAGEKQKLGRAYDFVKVVEWCAQRADMILLLFDAHKLDVSGAWGILPAFWCADPTPPMSSPSPQVSDELQAVIKALKGNDDKIRVVLNKADKITSQQLMRVYGALMWSLGKVIATPEVARVYIGSFWDGECMNPDLLPMFKAESADLLHDLHVRRHDVPGCGVAMTPTTAIATCAGAATQRGGTEGERAGEARPYGPRACHRRGAPQVPAALFWSSRRTEEDAGKHGG